MTQLRSPLSAASLQPWLPAGWTVQVTGETGSTNADLLAAAASGAAAGTVLVAEVQTSGRGRLDRSWQSPAGAGLTLSVLLRPRAPVGSWGWLPLLAGLALARTIDADLKWPNDVLLGPDQLKVAGILAQSAGDAAVLGVGLNVSTTADELPVPTATSLVLQGNPLSDRGDILVRFVAALDADLTRWQDADGDAVAAGVAAEYRSRCVTIGTSVRVEQPGGALLGRAVAVDDGGRLLIQPEAGGEPIPVSAGDVTHVRPAVR